MKPATASVKINPTSEMPRCRFKPDCILIPFAYAHRC
jgi:hypothetical protein